MPASYPTHDVSGGPSSLSAPDLAFGIVDDYVASFDPNTWFDPDTWFGPLAQPVLEDAPFPSGQPGPAGIDPRVQGYEEDPGGSADPGRFGFEDFEPRAEVSDPHGLPVWPAAQPPQGALYAYGRGGDIQPFTFPRPPRPEPWPEEEVVEEAPPSPYWGVPVTATYPIRAS